MRIKLLLILILIPILIIGGCTKEKEYNLKDLNNGDKVEDFSIEEIFISEDKREVTFVLSGEAVVEGVLAFGSGLHENLFVLEAEDSPYSKVKINVDFVDNALWQPTFDYFLITNQEILGEELMQYVQAGNTKKVKLKVSSMRLWARWESENEKVLTIEEVIED